MDEQIEGKIRIREAVSTDKAWVIDTMNHALSQFYDGDHTAHAERIFSAHLEGGIDKYGFFSFEQKMFIAVIDNESVGMIHIVGKKQNTYKISPLIVLPNKQGLGVGKCLLDYVEKYISCKAEIRQIYCTVAETNESAKYFFTKNGFIKAGTADSQYKIGIPESMYYKPFDIDKIIRSLEEGTISVIELCEASKEIKSAVKEYILETLPKDFNGIDESWVDALFRGYDRKETAEVNMKYKIIYVAINQDKELVGIAAATPKKGAPIKIMPLIAKSMVALIALLTDLPFQLSKYGRKLYIHINPDSNTVKLLQLKGWKHDSDFPEAYHRAIVTQQWSYDLKSDIQQFLRVKSAFLQAMKSREKKIEIRVGYDTIKAIRPGDKINFITYIDYICSKILEVHNYTTLDDMLKFEDFRAIMPWAKTPAEVHEKLKEFYPDDKIKQFGVIAFHFEIIE